MPRPIAPPAIPAAPAPYAVNIPAPADTVTQTRIAAPVRTHTRITPQVTNVVPQVVVNKYNVDVPVAVPRAVPREIIVNKHVAKPYEVPVPRAVHVAAPYKVHPVQEVSFVISLYQTIHDNLTFLLDRRDPPHPPRHR